MIIWRYSLEDQDNREEVYVPLEGADVSKAIHNVTVKDMPRSRVDASYHSIIEKAESNLEYRGITINMKHDLRVVTLNVNGLTSQKLSEILWWIQVTKTDVFICIDTRATERESKHYHQQCYRTLGATTVVRSAPVSELVEKIKPQQKQNALVGGQMVIVNKKWGPHVTSFWKDSTGYGILTATMVRSQTQSILILGTYWPHLASSKNHGELYPLWSKVERWMQQHKEQGSPLAYIQNLISAKTNTHIYNKGKSTGNITILAGDLNSNFKEKGASGGCHKGTVKWAEETGWVNQSHNIASQMTTPLATHCSKNVPDSWIDHILIHETSHRCEQMGVATSEGAFWSTVSDHRPLIADFKIVGGLRGGATPLPSKPKPKMVQPELMNSVQIEALHEAQDQWLVSNPLNPNASDEEIGEHLRAMSDFASVAVQQLKSTAWHRNRRNNTYVGGWSPTMMLVKKQLETLTEILCHVKGLRGRRKWENLEQQGRGLIRLMKSWEGVAGRYTYPEGINKWDLMEEGGYGPNFWRTYSKLLDERVVIEATKIAWRNFHGKKRKEDRKKYSEFLVRQAELVERKQYKAFIKSSLGERTEQYNLEYVNKGGDDFTTHPMECHNIATEVMHKWHEAPKDYNGTIHHKDFDWKASGHDMRLLMRIAKGMNIPYDVAKTIVQAFREAPKAQLVRAQLAVELATPPTFMEFYE